MCCCQTEVLRVDAWLVMSCCLPCCLPLFTRSRMPSWLAMDQNHKGNGNYVTISYRDSGGCWHHSKIGSFSLPRPPPKPILKGQQSSLKNKSNLPETFWISLLKFGRTDVVPALALPFLLTSSCVTSPSAQPLLNAQETVSFLHCPQKARDGLVPGPCVVSILFYLLKRFQHFSSRLLLTRLSAVYIILPRRIKLRTPVLTTDNVLFICSICCL